MTDITARSTFEALCRALDMPTVQCAPKDRVGHLPPWVRGLAVEDQFPAWFQPSLMVTPAAREKLRAWAERTPRPQLPSVTELVSALRVVGDEYLALEIARICLERLPLPVVSYLVDHVVIVATGYRVLAFCGPARLTDDTRPWQLNVASRGPGDQRFPELFAHEAAHAWSLEPPALDTCCGSAVWASAINSLDLGHVPPEFRERVVNTRDAYNANEDVADRLARSWGFRSIEEADEW